MDTIFYALLSALILYVLYLLARIGHRPNGYPPGPPTLPVLGNIHLNPHLQFQIWANQYGGVYSLMLGTKTMIVLSSDNPIKDLLDKKSAIYSGRPDLYTGQTLMSGDKRMVMMNYGSPWRTHPLLQTLFENLDNYVRLNTTGGAMAADFYPILRYLPTSLMPSKREALDHYNHEIKLYTDLYLATKRSREKLRSTSRPCVCDDVVEVQAKEGFSDEYTAHIPAQLWEAGSDTTSTQLYAFVQALLLYPHIQAKGQAELDFVVGPDRMPTLEDMSSLPYVRACVKESFRWHPTAVLGAFPHSTSENDTYNGYRIPKNAIILTNTWAIHRDPKRYPNPSVFDPERFIGDNTTSSESANCMDVSKRDHFGFGAGRRICPGMNVADRSMLLGISRIFWAFDIKPKKGKALPTQDDFEPGFVAIPKRFDVDVKPRSDGREKIVRSEWEKAKEGLDEDGQFLGGWGGPKYNGGQSAGPTG
ncbi:cytochrome P450 [Ophiobolus disseminans]|uniref:Cytochrome P450 n=1 Tax=Ophiobolus disseminans TaxID=1469910 RepID=A0A6A7A990_9PLEO|nr:cytochrome P450 [Ophiobolus disseminans]